MKKKLSIIICVVFTFVMLTCSVSAVTFTPDFEVYSEAAYLVSLDTGDVVYSKNADEQLVPASLTKIMTAAILLELYQDDISALSTTYVCGTSACFDELYLTGASTADIQIGEMVSYKDLLYALMLRSACEAANIIAYNVAGSLEAFVEMMNEKAEELGCENTHFTNAHGLFYENHYTTAYDMAIITQYAMSLPMFTEIACTESYTMEATSYHEERTIIHTNYMMSKTNGGDYYYEYVKGIKTGTLDEAGRCLVSLAYKDGYSYLLVTLNAPMYDDNGNTVYYNFIDHKNIYEWAFNNLVYTEIITGTEEKAEVAVEYGDGQDYVIVVPAEKFSMMWNTNISTSSIHEVITLSSDVVAPVSAGDVLGTLELQYGGETLAVIDLISETDLARSESAETLAIMQSFIGSNQFYKAAMYSAIFFLVYTVLIIVLKIIVHRVNKKRVKVYATPKRQSSKKKW
ncbi:MAG: D-alanyl-D-alanine carboxypeptidase [Oscillospiraceae bacterium]|nr:D-alanyl-D-alanine carboxypeptidase [Oscillospiraceae bacterium]